MAKWKVYLSSTFVDLQNRRAEIISYFEKQLKGSFELTTIMERMYDDGSHAAFELDCRKAVQDCHIYINILGNKVGSFPPNSTRTYTEIEMDEAIAGHKKMFFFMLDPFDAAEIDNPVKHDELRNKLLGKNVHLVSNLETVKYAFLECLTPFINTSPVNTTNPYKGLTPFEPEDGAYFFGRKKEMDEFLTRIVASSTAKTYISITGNSGIGKTSFVQAGLLYRLKHQPEYGYAGHKQLIINPGVNPFDKLVVTLRLNGIEPFIADGTLNSSYGDEKLIFFFNQFEEIITQCTSPDAILQRNKLFNYLDHLHNNVNLREKLLIITTFRSEFTSALYNFDFIKRHQLLPLNSLDYTVSELNWRQSITEIIELPAQKNGVAIEKALVDRLLTELKEVDGSLPILGLVLEKIWTEDTVKDGRIDSAEYDVLFAARGISGAIEAKAEEVFSRITDKGGNHEKENIFRIICLNLVEVTDSRHDVRKTIVKTELLKKLVKFNEQAAADVYHKLEGTDSRLLVEKTVGNITTVELVHEVIIMKWDRLRTWINDRRAGLEKIQEIEKIARRNKTEKRRYLTRAEISDIEKIKKENNDLVLNTDALALIKDSSKRLNLLVSKISVAAFLLTIVLVFGYQKYKKDEFFAEIHKVPQLENAIQQYGGDIDSVTSLELDNVTAVYLNGITKYFKGLDTLSIDNTEIGSLSSMSNSSSIEHLSLQLNKALSNIEGIAKLTNLRSLTIYACDSLKTLNGVDKLNKFDRLDLHTCNGLNDVSAIRNAKSLRNCSFEGCNALSDFPGMENAKNLDSIALKECSIFKSLLGLCKAPSLHYLSIDGSDSLIDIAAIQSLTQLKTLEIKSCGGLHDFSITAKMKGLNKFVLENCGGMTDLSSIGSTGNLDSLFVNSCSNLKSLAGVTVSGRLRFLSLYNNQVLDTLAGIESFENLLSLEILSGKILRNLSGIEQLKKLHALKINSCDSLEDWRAVAKIKNLDSLGIYHCSKLKKLGAPVSFKRLRSFDIENIDINIFFNDSVRFEELKSLGISNTGIVSNLLKMDTAYRRSQKFDLQKIKVLPSIVSLSLHDIPDLEDMAWIENFQQLTSLELANNNNLGSLRGIEKLHALEHLAVRNNMTALKIEDLQSFPKLKTITVYDNALEQQIAARYPKIIIIGNEFSGF